MSGVVVKKKTNKQSVQKSVKPTGRSWRLGLRDYRSDRFLLITVGLLVLVGLFCLASSSAVVAYTEYGDAYFWLKKQLLPLLIGVIGFYCFSQIDYRHWQKLAGFILIATIGLLLTLFTPLAKESFGSTAWLNIFGFSFQPSEMVKLSLTLYLSALMAKFCISQDPLEKKRLNWIFWGVLGVVAVLILAQPDLGTLLIIVATSLVIYLVGGGNWKWLSIVSVAGAAVLLVFIFMHGGYQKDRFLCVFKPGYSPDNRCYQVNQSLIAIGSGGFWGRGVGASRQKYLYIPLVQNDFVFPIIAEELGWLFSLFLLGLYYAIFYRGYQVSRLVNDPYGQILAMGIVSGMLVQVLFNLGGVLNILPMTGVTLPLVSYGGSSLMSSLFSLGILANISSQAGLADQIIKNDQANKK